MSCRIISKIVSGGLRSLVFLCLFSGGVVGQDIIFSQHYISPTLTNSAFAGLNAYPNFSANYRLQWPGLTSAYNTYALTYDQYFPAKNIGLGASVLTDDQGGGTLKTTKLKGIISYNLRFGDGWQLKFGVGAAYVRNSLDWDRLIFSDQLDPQFGFVDALGNPLISMEQRPAALNNGFFDLDLGFLVYNPKYYFGISMIHANNPYDGFLFDQLDGTEVSLPILLSLTAGYQIVIDYDNKGNPSTFISPNLLYARQSSFDQVNIGAYVQRDRIFGGIWMRHTLDNLDAWIFSAGVLVNTMRISYSFDLTTSQLGFSNSGGSHEIGITVGLEQLEKKVSKLNDCLSLFR